MARTTDDVVHAAARPLSPATALHRLRLVALKAGRAPSVHNTQPWAFISSPTGFAVRADRTRQLGVLDPTGRQLILSCGCALFNARVGVAAAGLHAHVVRFPDPADPDLIARIDIGSGTDATADLAALDGAILRRHNNRRRFESDPVPDDLIAALHRAADAEGADLVELSDPAHRAAFGALSVRADALQITDPAYRAELRAWTSPDLDRLDGVPARAVPHVDAGTGHGDVPMRDFDSHGLGGLPIRTESDAELDRCLLVLGMARDEPDAWVRAGEALERILLEIARYGVEPGVTSRSAYTAGIMSQAIEIPELRAELRSTLHLRTHPLIVVRVGRAAPTPGTPRRRLEDVLIEHR